MKITLLPSGMSAGGVLLSQYLTSFLVNDHVAIDAGSLGFYRNPAEQAAVRHVFLSHSHLDHWASLPTFLVNVVGMGNGPVHLYASEDVLTCLREDVFNTRVWPNFLTMTHEGRPFVVPHTIGGGQAMTVEGLRITPVPVNHTVPTLGFILEDATSAIVIASDTAATTEIWQRANATANLKAIFLEATVPDELARLADVAKHLTPATFVSEMDKVTRPATFLAVHLSARARDQVIAELIAHGRSNLEIAQFGKTYEF